MPAFELEELPAATLQEQLRSRKLTAERLTRLYLERIELVDRNGPALRSVIETNPDAMTIAKALHDELRSRGPRGPLHGIPVLLKDNIDTGDRMQTTAGSLALEGSPAPKDSWVAERLRAAGAVILGKTNLSEWANWRSTHSSSGWSGRGGQTKNPYALDRNPCGSSSGSGAAVSASFCALAVGSETDGSVVCPSSMCGIVGIKPTLGLISRSGIVPIAHSQDTAGPMARSVQDAALLLGALVGIDPQRSGYTGQLGKVVPGLHAVPRCKGPERSKTGDRPSIFHDGSSRHRDHGRLYSPDEAIGRDDLDPTDLPTFEQWRETETQVLTYEFKSDLNAYLEKRGAAVKSLEDCIRFNKEHAAREMPYFRQELFEQSQAKGPLSEKAYKEALARITS